MKTFKYITLLFMVSFLFIGCSEDTLDDIGIGTITGVVVEKGSNEPIENARVSTNPPTSTVFTDENGEFIIADIPVEDYSVEARKEGLLTMFEGANVLADASVNVIFEMEKEKKNNKQPSVPTAVFPQDKAEGIPTTTEFHWSSSDPDADNLVYSLEIRNDKDEEILMITDIRDTIYTVDGLDYSNKYFWQVRVSDQVNEEVLSPLFSFRTMPVPESRKLFARNVGGNNVIFAMNDAGTEFQLTSSSHNSFRPRKNNSSNLIAFLRTVGGQTHLFTMNPDGTGQRQITTSIPVNGFNLDQVDYSWSDKGAALIFPSFDKLYHINVLGGGIDLIYQTGGGDFITEVAVSNDKDLIALVTNDNQGYKGNLFTINFDGEVQDRILTDTAGAVGGLDWSIRNEFLLYSHDASGFEDETYRRLDSRLFLYTFSSGETTDLSLEKPVGTNDLDPRFAPNDAQIIFVNTSNDGISQKDVYTMNFNGSEENNDRVLVVNNSYMPDWE